MRRGIVGLAVGFALSACATPVDPVTRNLPLKMALTEPVDVLEARAVEGDRQAQYAVSFLANHGLRGVAQDRVRAEGLRAQAGETRSRSQPIYVPGVNGNPGTLTYVTITDPGVSDDEARRLDLCAFTLMIGQPALGGQMCGSAEAYIDLLPAAVALRADMQQAGAVLPDLIDPQSVTDCAATDPLWTQAARRMASQDTPGATAAADRIIALCGDGERFWHARVMRASLALDAVDAASALDFLQPVPSPAPPPIGAFGEHVRIAAFELAGQTGAAAAARQALAEASLSALETRAAATGALVERSALGNATLVSFERRVQYFPGIVSLKTLIVEGEPARLTAHQLTRHGSMTALEGPWFLDAFDCSGRATVAVFEAEPQQDEIVERILAYRSAPSAAITRTITAAGSGPICRWPVQTAPGLGDDRTVVSSPVPGTVTP